MTSVDASRPRVKICGLRDAEHAVIAADTGADFLGFVFVEGVRRQLAPDQAKVLIARYRAADRGVDRKRPKLVGLFRNQPVQWVRSVVDEIGLDIAQLCGDEDLAYAAELSVPVLKQLRVRESDGPAEVAHAAKEWLEAGHMVVLDAYDPSTPGGAGRTFDWSAAAAVGGSEGVLLAGGLTPDNVTAAIEQLDPWAVDVSSGVETGGIKDRDKIERFIAAVRAS